MSDLRQCSREFLSEFIALYQSYPCLWQIKCKEYCDRDMKNQAYEALVSKYRECDSSAKRETVVRKINSIRSVFRKEMTKVNKSYRSSSAEDEVYTPSLWYYDLLLFLRDQEIPRQSKSTIDEEEASAQEFQKGAPESDLDAPRSSEAPATPISEINSIGSLSRNSSTRKRKGISNKDATTEVIALVGKKLESLQAEDEFQVFGKHVANKLRNVNSEQNIVAQKLISHILFEAGMGSLNRNFRMVDMSVRQQDNFATLSGQNICLQNVPREWDSAYSQYQILVNSTPQSGTPKRRVSEEFPSHRDYTTIGEYTNTFDEN